MYGSSVTSGNAAGIIDTSSIFAMLAAQYTILKDIHLGHRNWIEVLGVLLVLLGATISSVVEICQSYKCLKAEKRRILSIRNTKDSYLTS